MAWLQLVLSALLLSVCGVAACAEHPAPYGNREDVAVYLDTLTDEHGFSRKDLQVLFEDARQRQDIIDRISRPAEKTWTWARYKSHLVDADRVAGGVEFWSANEATLARAAQTYGVAPEYVVAILGIETRYGQLTGNYRVLDALTTLGFDYPPRAKFFRKELTQFLLLAREEGKNPAQLKGSYAGAMGYGQFIPSSYRHYAVDFDADGVRDIWQNSEDAIGSIANYFARHKWRGDGPVAIPVDIAPGSDEDRLSTMANASLDLTQTLASMAALGVHGRGDEAKHLDPQRKVALFKLDAEGGDEYWLGLHDFHVITRYNHSHLYAFAVHELSRAIKAKRG
jgi:membrane-bound lytic murein transglycosylase B